jgi:hypothetical protein
MHSPARGSGYTLQYCSDALAVRPLLSLTRKVPVIRLGALKYAPHKWSNNHKLRRLARNVGICSKKLGKATDPTYQASCPEKMSPLRGLGFVHFITSSAYALG